MSGVDRASSDVGRPFAPRLQRSTGACSNPAAAPKHEKRHGDLVASVEVSLVMIKVGMSARAVVFANGVNAQRIAKSGQIVCKRAGVERVSASFRPTAKGVTEIFIWPRLNQMLGQGIRLGEKHPVIYAQRQ